MQQIARAVEAVLVLGVAVAAVVVIRALVVAEMTAPGPRAEHQCQRPRHPHHRFQTLVLKVVVRFTKVVGGMASSTVGAVMRILIPITLGLPLVLSRKGNSSAASPMVCALG